MKCKISWGTAVAHRRANRFPATVVSTNRGTSSKPPRFFCHRQRFADFPDGPFCCTPCNPLRRMGCLHPAAGHLPHFLSPCHCEASDRCHWLWQSAPPCKKHVIARPVRKLVVAIRTPVPSALLPKGGWHGEAVTGGFSPRTNLQQTHSRSPRKYPSTNLRLVPLPLGKGGFFA